MLLEQILAGTMQGLPGTVRLTQTRHGLMLYPAEDIFIGPSLEAYGEYSPEEGRMFELLLRPGDVVLEVGANIGAHTLLLAQAVGPAGRVHAIEPQRRLFQMLCGNLALNDVRNVHARQLGLGAAPEMLWVSTPATGTAANFGGVCLLPQGEEAVDVVTLDDLRLERLDLIKVDVEGMEEAVLRGGLDTIRRLRPKLYVENDRADKSAPLISLIRDLGYRIWWHLPGLYSPENYRGASHNIFEATYVSVNMLCCRAEDTIITNLCEVMEETERPQL
jgi:FkbM family methyltransferase